jgi:hypothetical protein
MEFITTIKGLLLLAKVTSLPERIASEGCYNQVGFGLA